MAAEDGVTDMHPMATPAMHPEPEASARIPSGILRPAPAEEAGDDDRTWRGIRVIDQQAGEEPSLLVEIRIAELPRWKPRMDFDQPRGLTDDE